MQRITWFLSWVSLKEVNWNSICNKKWNHCHCATQNVDQQLNFYYLDPVATMDRFIRQPKFASKACMKFESQESEQRLRIRQESKLPVSGSPDHRHAQRPIAALTLCWQILLWHPWKFVSHILWMATVWIILHKQQKLHMLHIYGYSHLVLCHCRELPELPWRLSNESRERVTVAWISVYDPDKSKLSTEAMEVYPARAVELYHSCWRISGDLC